MLKEFYWLCLTAVAECPWWYGIALYDMRENTRGTKDNYLNMSEQFIAMFAKGRFTAPRKLSFGAALPPPPPPPPPPGSAVTTANLYLRSGPGASNQPITIMPTGTPVTVIRVVDGWAEVSANMPVWYVPMVMSDSSYTNWVQNKISVSGWCSYAYLK